MPHISRSNSLNPPVQSSTDQHQVRSAFQDSLESLERNEVNSSHRIAQGNRDFNSFDRCREDNLSKYYFNVNTCRNFNEIFNASDYKSLPDEAKKIIKNPEEAEDSNLNRFTLEEFKSHILDKYDSSLRNISLMITDQNFNRQTLQADIAFLILISYNLSINLSDDESKINEIEAKFTNQNDEKIFSPVPSLENIVRSLEKKGLLNEVSISLNDYLPNIFPKNNINECIELINDLKSKKGLPRLEGLSEFGFQFNDRFSEREENIQYTPQQLIYKITSCKNKESNLLHQILDKQSFWKKIIMNIPKIIFSPIDVVRAFLYKISDFIALTVIGLIPLVILTWLFDGIRNLMNRGLSPLLFDLFDKKMPQDSDLIRIPEDLRSQINPNGNNLIRYDLLLDQLGLSNDQINSYLREYFISQYSDWDLI